VGGHSYDIVVLDLASILADRALWPIQVTNINRQICGIQDIADFHHLGGEQKPTRCPRFVQTVEVAEFATARPVLSRTNTSSARFKTTQSRSCSSTNMPSGPPKLLTKTLGSPASPFTTGISIIVPSPVLPTNMVVRGALSDGRPYRDSYFGPQVSFEDMDR
jgi:hypothetical protein